MTFDDDELIEKAALEADRQTGEDIHFRFHSCKLLWQAAQKEAAKRCADICQEPDCWDENEAAERICREFGLDES